MVYARMEHLQTIAKYILGDALPADPASPDAVAGVRTHSSFHWLLQACVAHMQCIRRSSTRKCNLLPYDLLSAACMNWL